jgi:Holliday junction DNA helicase RuvA
MIARLEGQVLHVEEGYVIVDVGGVAFGVFVPADFTVRVGESVVLHTYLQVRESELSLYGFLEREEKHLFELLMSVSGVGPKAALSVLSTLSPDTLRRAILNDQPEVLTRAQGVGKKTGRSIILHLKDKIKQQDVVDADVAEDDADVIAALTALGFSIVEAQRAIQQLPPDEDLTLDDKIRRALVFLGQ